MRKDPICGAIETFARGFEYHGKWYCCDDCLEEAESGVWNSRLTSASRFVSG